MKILIVEDYVDFLEILVEELAIHQITAVYDALRACEMLTTNEFDLVITDINMPGTGGGERIVQEASEMGVPVVVVTVKDYLQFQRILNLGADKVFCKMRELEDLTKYVENFSSNIREC